MTPHEKSSEEEVIREVKNSVRKFNRGIGWDVVWKVAVIVGLILNLWLNKNYVSREDYKEDLQLQKEENTKRDAQIKIMSDTLIEMKTQNGVNSEFVRRFESIEKKDDDLELRMRAVEQLKRDK